jgi:hypothetical protein
VIAPEVDVRVNAGKWPLPSILSSFREAKAVFFFFFSPEDEEEEEGCNAYKVFPFSPRMATAGTYVECLCVRSRW